MRKPWSVSWLARTKEYPFCKVVTITQSKRSAKRTKKSHN